MCVVLLVLIGCSEKKKTDATSSDPTGTPESSETQSLSQEEAVAAAKAALAPDAYKRWDKPDVMLFVTGQQSGYIEPCGCTGLDRQKGGIARRATLMKQLRSEGWDIVPIDVGNQVRRIGRQASIKLGKSDSALKKMGYQSVGFGPDDLRLPPDELLAIAAADDSEIATYVSGNVVIFDASLVPQHKVVSSNGVKVGLTSIIDPSLLPANLSEDVEVGDPRAAISKAIGAMDAAGAKFKVVSFFGSEKSALEIARDITGIDLIIASGTYGEPSSRPSVVLDTHVITTGHKGMYAGLVGLYEGKSPEYTRVPLTHDFGDDAEMRSLMADYQKELEQLGLARLGLDPVEHPSGHQFVGTKACVDCHQEAYDVWESSPHAHATDSIVSPPEDRSDVPRHFDPECLSCHVTGWNPQNYFPYESGYVDLEQSKHLHGNGCENCHGPGSAHVAAEQEDSGVAEERRKALRLEMRLPYERAKDHCMKCHDLDNSPDFHESGAFEDEYWPQIEH